MSLRYSLLVLLLTALAPAAGRAQAVRTLPGHHGPVTAVAYRPEGPAVLTVNSMDGDLAALAPK